MKKTEEKGITLIALIITIIVMLILVGVTVNVALKGDLFETAKDAASKTQVEADREELLSAVVVAFDKNSGKVDYNKLPPEGWMTEKEGIYTSPKGNTFTVTEDGEILDGIDIEKYVKVGDYVDYNPIIADKDGNTVEGSKLTYSSPVGTAREHGNGDSVQNFTATADTKWRVLNIENGIVELISENVIKTADTNANFVLRGAIGYLYAEQELNEACKIFGYGYGADTTKGGNYTTGGPIDTPTIGKIEGTGARSITIEDINKKAGIYEDKTDGKMKYSDGTVIHNNYGSTRYPEIDAYYPTVNGDIITGGSNSAGVKNLKYTYYGYRKTDIENTDIQNMLFNGMYWLASREVTTDYSRVGYGVHTVVGETYYTYINNIKCAQDVFVSDGAYHSDGEDDTYDDYGIRPVVSLKSDIIDISTNYDTEGEWKLK